MTAKEIAEKITKTGHDTIYMAISHTPLYVVALHRIARLGRADIYAGQRNRFVQIAITPELEEKWKMLENVERVTLIYKDFGA